MIGQYYEEIRVAWAIGHSWLLAGVIAYLWAFGVAYVLRPRHGFVELDDIRGGERRHASERLSTADDRKGENYAS